MSKRKYPMVVVDWEDACHRSGYYDPSDGAAGCKTIMVKTLGYLLKHDRKRVIVASEYFKADDDLRDVHTIPRGMVRKITRLKEMEVKHD